MTPWYGSNVPDRNRSGPACPRTPPGPSMATADAAISTSSTAIPLKVAFGKSPVMIWAHRFAACWKMVCWAAVSPVICRVMLNPPVVGGGGGGGGGEGGGGGGTPSAGPSIDQT